MAESKPGFTLPPIKDNSIGWGPASDVLPEQFRDIPYAPYSKGDKLGRIADWSAPETQKQDNREVSGRTGRQGFNRFNKGVCDSVLYIHICPTKATACARSWQFCAVNTFFMPSETCINAKADIAEDPTLCSFDREQI